MKSDKIHKIFLMTIFGMLGSILVGFLFYQFSIFFPRRSTFQFVIIGLYGSSFFSLLEYKHTKEQLLSIALIILFQIIVFTGRYFTISYLIRDLTYLSALFISVKFYHLFIKKYNWTRLFLRAFALVLFYGIINALFAGALFLYYFHLNIPSLYSILGIARYSVLIGLGMGIGIDFYLKYGNDLFRLLKPKTV